MKGWVKGRPLRFMRGHANRIYQRPPLDGTDYRVEDRGYATPCWIWRGKPNNKGYGKVTIAGRIAYAHRAMYEQEVGPITAGLEIDHLCRTRLCCRPDHLEAVPHAVNTRRGLNAKLSDEQVVAIRADSRSCAKIAADFGVSSSHVWRIRAGVKRAPSVAR